MWVSVNYMNISLSLYMIVGSSLDELILKGEENFWRAQKLKSIRKKPSKAKTQYNLQIIKN